MFFFCISLQGFIQIKYCLNQKVCLLACADSECLDQPAHAHACNQFSLNSLLSDQSLHCPLIESLDTVDYIRGSKDPDKTGALKASSWSSGWGS